MVGDAGRDELEKQVGCRVGLAVPDVAARGLEGQRRGTRIAGGKIAGRRGLDRFRVRIGREDLPRGGGGGALERSLVGFARGGGGPPGPPPGGRAPPRRGGRWPRAWGR